MICRKEDEVKRILIDEIKFLIIDSLQVVITTSLINELSKKKVKIMFVDETHNPLGEIVTYQNNYYSYRKIKEQILFTSLDRKDVLWQSIIAKKIINQSRNLKLLGKDNDYDKLQEYAKNVQIGDVSNREGHAAKVYFYSLFGPSFLRSDSSLVINKYLNYGYSILLSIINREIKILGYLTELGIHHIGESNHFNLSYDLIEPLRPIVDYYVIFDNIDDSNYRRVFANMLSLKVSYNEKEFYLDNAIHLYVEDMLSYLISGEENKVRFIEYEF